MKPNYELKAEVLKLGLDVTEREVSRAMFFSNNPQYNVITPINWSTAAKIFNYYHCNFPDLWKEAQRLNHSRYQRIRRLKNFIFGLISNYECVFLTFTFNDNSLNNQTAETRKTYVTRYLKQYDAPYVANIDFGKQNGREHYHAVVGCNKLDYKSWKGGIINGERVRDTKKSSEKLAKYVAKLTNHAIKETAKRSSLIYSRSEKTKELMRKTLEECSKKYGEKHSTIKITDFEPVETDFLPFTSYEQQDILFD